MDSSLSDFFPELVEQARGLYTVLVGVTMVLAFAGIIAGAIKGTAGDLQQTMKAVISAGIVAVVLNVFPSWVDDLQQMAHSLVEQLHADPSASHERFAMLVAGPEVANGQPGFWDILWQSDGGGIGKAIVFAMVMLASKLAMAILYLAYLVQRLVVIMSIAIAPLFLGMLLLETTRSVAVRFLTTLLAVIIWPVGWAASDVVTAALLRVAASDKVYEEAGGNIVLSATGQLFLMILVSIWICASTIAAPYALTKALQTGTLIGGSLLSGFAGSVSQGLSFGLGAGVTSNLAGNSTVTSGAAAAVAGVGGAFSGAAGSTGIVLPAAIGALAAMAGGASASRNFDEEADKLAAGSKKSKS